MRKSFILATTALTLLSTGITSVVVSKNLSHKNYHFTNN